MTAIELYRHEKALYLARNAGAAFVSVLMPRAIVPERVKIEQKRAARKEKREAARKTLEERRAYHREYYARHREQRIAQMREYRKGYTRKRKPRSVSI